MIKIINNQDREKLCEGRDHGLGFAFLKNTTGETFETVQPISPCKDYLNDVVYAENTGNNCGAYGLEYTPTKCFKPTKSFMAMQVCDYQNGGGKYKGIKKELQLMEDLHGLNEYINKFEEMLGIKHRSKISKIEDNLFFITLPTYWCRSTYLISMYSLLIRVGRWYKSGEDVIQYLKDFKHDMEERYLINSALPNIQKVLEVKNIKQDLTLYDISNEKEYDDDDNEDNPVHDEGICALKL